LRLRRDLVDDLLNGTDEESALARASALDYDLQRRVTASSSSRAGASSASDALFQAVRTAAREGAVAHCWSRAASTSFRWRIGRPTGSRCAPR
jgi:hypothetical protein